MNKINKKIEIVCTNATGLSSMSQKSRSAILEVLTKNFTQAGITIINNLSDLEDLVVRRPDLVFLGMNFVPLNPALGLQDPDIIWISEYLDMHDIAYTGSNQMAQKLDVSKHLAKQCIIDAGLNTSKFYVTSQTQPKPIGNSLLTFPMFIKPTSRRGGAGIDSNSVAHNYAELDSKVQSIANDLQSDSLVEEYLPGREFSVAILKDEKSAEFAVMPLELIAPPDKHGVRILSAQVKSSDTESFKEVTDEILKAKVSLLAINVFYALGARDYGRIDIRLDKVGTPQFLEANLIPSLIEGYGNFLKACKLNLNLDYEPMIMRIVELGLRRSLGKSEDVLEPSVLHTSVFPSLETAIEPAKA